MGFTEVLTVVFIVLKLMGIIDWSWWLVLLPEIISIIFNIIMFFLAALYREKRRQDFWTRMRKAPGVKVYWPYAKKGDAD